MSLEEQVAALTARIEALEKAKRRSHTHLLSKREAAKRLGVDRGTTLEVLIATKQLKTVRTGKRVRIPAAEVERLVREGYKAPS